VSTGWLSRSDPARERSAHNARGLGGSQECADALARQRTEPWYKPQRIECKMTTVDPGQMAAARFAVEGVRNGVPVITMEHITRLTATAAPHWEYPPDNQVGVHRVVVEGDPRVELNTHVSHPVLDSTDAGCISTASRVVNAIDWICRAPKGLIAVEDIPQVELIRGLMC
jgi:hypothetical protein